MTIKYLASKTSLAIALAVSAPLADAAPISGVGVTTTFANPGDAGSLISQITDGSGLSSYTPTATHDAASATNAWTARGPTVGTITFNLGAVYVLDGMAVWNFSAANGAGIQGLTVEGSTDGVIFTTIAGAPGAFAKGASSASEASQQFSFSRTAGFIRFDVVSNYGGNGVGLDEVMFTGVRTSTNGVPEPESVALLGIGLLAAVGAARRSKSRTA